MERKTKLETSYKVIRLQPDGMIREDYKERVIIKLVEIGDYWSEADALERINLENDYAQYQILPYLKRMSDFD